MRIAILAALAAMATASACVQPTKPDANRLIAEDMIGSAVCADPIDSKATKEFVENYAAAGRALQEEEWTGALGAAALARPHARTGQQANVLLDIEIAAYDGLKDRSAEIEKINAALASPCIPPTVAKNYNQMLKQFEDEAAAEQQH